MSATQPLWYSYSYAVPDVAPPVEDPKLAVIQPVDFLAICHAIADLVIPSWRTHGEVSDSVSTRWEASTNSWVLPPATAETFYLWSVRRPAHLLVQYLEVCWGQLAVLRAENQNKQLTHSTKIVSVFVTIKVNDSRVSVPGSGAGSTLYNLMADAGRGLSAAHKSSMPAFDYATATI